MTTKDGIIYQLNGDNKASVLGLEVGNNNKDIVIPETVTINDKNYNVTSIDYKAFYETSIETIVIPKSITSIGIYAFNGSKLKTVKFLGDKPEIGEGVFLADSFFLLYLVKLMQSHIQTGKE